MEPHKTANNGETQAFFPTGELQPIVPEETPVPTEPPKVTVVPQPKRKKTSPWNIVWYCTRFVLRMALGVALAVAVLAAGLIGYLTVTEYSPAYAENADRGSVNAVTQLDFGQTYRIISFNTGYAGLGEDADFFMDGGESVNPESEAIVLDNMSGIERILSESDADFLLLQEVDTDSDRSFHQNQWLRYESTLKTYESRFALNYSCDYVPYPFTDPLGEVHSGLATYSRYDIRSATRYSLQNEFEWPTRVAQLKRCLLVSRLPIAVGEGQEPVELVLINLHLEAYDDDATRIAQTKQLMELMEAEYAKGNYVIAGGDFNQSFPKATDRYPLLNEEYWKPGELKPLKNGWQYGYDARRAGCRLLNAPYDPRNKDTQFYIIDGFILSPNVELKTVYTMDEGFVYSDHNPVYMAFALHNPAETTPTE